MHWGNPDFFHYSLINIIIISRYEYGNIGKQVYDALKDGAYHQFKGYVAKKAVIATGDVEKIRLFTIHITYVYITFHN